MEGHKGFFTEVFQRKNIPGRGESTCKSWRQVRAQSVTALTAVPWLVLSGHKQREERQVPGDEVPKGTVGSLEDG